MVKEISRRGDAAWPNDQSGSGQEHRTLCLVGNPNCGKTTLFNDLTGAHQQVGNWPGVTVDRKEGRYRYHHWNLTVVDLPGVYALDAEDADTGLDETIARTYLASGESDLVINILDAANLERNLYLTTQLMEMRLPMIVVLNMVDVAEDRHIDIDVSALSEKLQCPVIPIVASRNKGIDTLKAAIATSLDRPIVTHAYVAYPPVVEEAIATLQPLITTQLPRSPVDSRWTALRLLEQDDTAAPNGSGSELVRALTEQRHRIHQLRHEDVDILIADSRYGWIRNLVQSAAHRQGEVGTTTSDRIDRIVLNRWLGIPIFLFCMYLLFLFTINVGGAFIDFFDIAAGTIFVDAVSHTLGGIGTPEWLVVLIANGVGGGIQTVATFIPVIAFLFLFVAVLEDSGYMARAAFVMDRFMRWVGLPGKSFVPMLIGFGCNVPAIMATRTLESRRDRLLTILMNPFMSCGARLPVYALFAAAFFPLSGQNVVFGLYLLGIAAAIFTGFVMKQTLLQGEISPFIMELPPYHIPTVKGVLLRTWDRLKAFILRAGKVIVIMVMILSLLSSIGTDGSFGNDDSDNSVLSSISRTITPAFAPMGIQQDNWPATVGIFTGVFAKEAVVGTLDSLYGTLAEEDAIAAGVEPEDEGDFSFWGGLGEAVSTIPANLAEVPAVLLDPLGLNVGDVSDIETAAEEQEVAQGTFGAMATRFDGQAGAFAYLLFVLMYFPCVAAMGAVFRETNAGWTAFVGLWTTGLAYWGATLFYQGATFSQHPTGSMGWIIGLAIALGATLLLLRSWRRALPQ
jgi:ferrous iron transport protein B